jgi:hypothetical protein
MANWTIIISTPGNIDSFDTRSVCLARQHLGKRARISEAQKARWRRVAEALAFQASQATIGVGWL